VSSLAGVHVAQIEERTGMKDRQQNAVADGRVADVEIPAPFPLPVDACRHFRSGAIPSVPMKA